jgi:hypothetical protein
LLLLLSTPVFQVWRPQELQKTPDDPGRDPAAVAL